MNSSFWEFTELGMEDFKLCSLDVVCIVFSVVEVIIKWTFKKSGINFCKTITAQIHCV